MIIYHLFGYTQKRVENSKMKNSWKSSLGGRGKKQFIFYSKAIRTTKVCIGRMPKLFFESGGGGYYPNTHSVKDLLYGFIDGCLRLVNENVK